MATTSLELDDVQGLLRTAYRTLPAADYSSYELGDPAGGRALLDQLRPSVTPASARAESIVTQLAISASGLGALGLPPELIAGFSPEFVGGMAEPARSHFLGDQPSGWDWGGSSGARPDLLVITFAGAVAELAEAVGESERLAISAGARLMRRRRISSLSDTEAFGFRDGISDPYVAELASSRQIAGAGSTSPVPVGEFILGYPNIYGRLTQRPVLPATSDPGRILPIVKPGSDAGYPAGGADLGRNGSYVVLRTLAQSPEVFSDHVTTAARSIGMDPELLAAKLVGRWRSGAPLAQSPDRDDPTLASANSFGYHRDDARGLRCPIGSHIRRANPRDSLDPQPGSAKSLEVTDRHRIMRRGRSYTDDTGRGLEFLALNANLSRQFEFVQHSWLNNPSFDGLYDDVDPLLSPRTTGSVFTIPADPVRARVRGLPDFVTTRGGAYFFLPGLRALRYLAAGSW